MQVQNIIIIITIMIITIVIATIIVVIIIERFQTVPNDFFRGSADSRLLSF